MRGCGRTGRPAFPAPSLGRKFTSKLEHMRREREAVSAIFRPRACEWSEAMDGCASLDSKLDCFAALAMTAVSPRERCGSLHCSRGRRDEDPKMNFTKIGLDERASRPSGAAPEEFSDRLLTSARGVGLQRPDAFGQR